MDILEGSMAAGTRLTPASARTLATVWAVLLSVCGAPTYKLIRNLVVPAKPADKTYKELVELVQKHHNPTPSAIVQRFKFNSRVRRQGETISEFVAALRQLTEHCAFGETLDDMLRDRLVCGLNEGRLQRRMLAETTLSFSKALSLAQAYESAEKKAHDLQLPQPAAPVHAVSGRYKRQDPPWKGTGTACYRCGGKHQAAQCHFKDAVCHSCGKTGHIARACRKKGGESQKSTMPRSRDQGHGRSTHLLTEDAESGDKDDERSVYTMFKVTTPETAKPLFATLQFNHAELRMEVDTGAALSIISEHTYRNLWPESTAPRLRSTDTRLCTYTGEEIPVLGAIEVCVEYQGQKENLSLLVVRKRGPSLLGRDWLLKIRLDWRELHQVRASPSLSLQELLDQHPDLFKDELGTVKGVAAQIHVEHQARPQFFRPRPVPYALRAKLEKELECLEETGVIDAVQFSDWAAPIVPVMKKDGSVSVCGDYKVTVNQVATLDTYPLPRIEDLFASLAGGKAFTKLDLAHAYQQVLLHEDSKQYVTINTHRGLYRYNRLPFGVASALAIFQRTMDTLL